MAKPLIIKNRDTGISTFGPVLSFVRLIKETQKNNMVVAEVGVFAGDTTVHYLPTIKQNNGKCYLIDWFMGSEVPKGIHRKGLISHDELLNIVKDRVDDIGCSDIVEILDMDTQAACEKITDESLDICFIDANHTYDSVKKDIQSYLPKVKPGGILCGHDCEGFELVGTFSKEDLNSDRISVAEGLYPNHGCHAGVVQAVYDSFGVVPLMKDFEGDQKVPVWIYKKPV